MYESPIVAIYENVKVQFEDDVLKALQKISVNVDKDELIKALAYDRGQYEKGYADREGEIVRCKDCKHRPTNTSGYKFGNQTVFPDDICPCQIGDNWFSWVPDDDFFCAYGERREDET